MTLSEVLNLLYRNEVNCQIDSFWDGGWMFRLGDKMNGFLAEDGPFYDLDEGASWLLKEFQKRFKNEVVN